MAQDNNVSSLSQDEQDRIANLNYEDARDELIAAVQRLEAGGLSLDESVRQWEYGEALAQRAQQLLQDVRVKLGEAEKRHQSGQDTAGTQENIR
ncbi:MAG: exodeoxyribonuclease VII small subunit [Aeriscardovia sp.]|nr:exodeoxyribonuclease VII small subunit [Aeriscardovia sp.]MBR2553285.1 exodeoxyribonuclease VII small subunit [Aeriscardovia sp.]